MNKNKIIGFFIILIILGTVLIYIGLTSEMPDPLPKEGTVCESEEWCEQKAPDNVPKEMEKNMEVIK